MKFFIQVQSGENWVGHPVGRPMMFATMEEAQKVTDYLNKLYNKAGFMYRVAEEQVPFPFSGVPR
jgi:hypothetical protein